MLKNYELRLLHYLSIYLSIDRINGYSQVEHNGVFESSDTHSGRQLYSGNGITLNQEGSIIVNPWIALTWWPSLTLYIFTAQMPYVKHQKH